MCRTTALMLAGIAVLVFVSHFVVLPGTVMVADDWANLARASRHASAADAIAAGLQDPHRPVSMAAIEWVYFAFGSNTRFFSFVTVMFNMALACIVVLISLELLPSRAAAWWSGAVFACVPILIETFHWSTQAVNEIACGLVFYFLSAYLWLRHLRGGGPGVLIASAVAYGIGLFAYEAGIFAPAALAVLLLPRLRASKAELLRLLPFAVIFGLYMAWRTTNAFGMNHLWTYPSHMQPHVTLSSLLYKAAVVVNAWVGGGFWQAVRLGMDGFSSIPLRLHYGLVVLNVAIAAAFLVAAGVLRRKDEEQSGQSPVARGCLFALAWFACTAAPCLVSYYAPRLMVLPALGAAILAGRILAGLDPRFVSGAALVVMPLCLAANQGTSWQWRESGIVHQRIYDHLRGTSDDWKDKEVLFFDTSSLRQRSTKGLLQRDTWHESAWAWHGNALLLRGFALSGMIQHIVGKPELEQSVVLDTECGGNLRESDLVWYPRYDPTGTRTTALNRVFVVDCWDVASRKP